MKKNAKLGQKVSWKGHVTYFLKFWDHLHISERLKLETSNFAYRLATGGPHEKKRKIRSKGPEGVTWPTFRILGNPQYQIRHADWPFGDLNEIMQN